MDARRKNINLNHQESTKNKEKCRTSRSCYNRPDVYYEPVSEFSVGQWNLHGPRLYPTMSDSAVCAYSLPGDYINPTFPIYPVLSANIYSTGIEHSRRSSRSRHKSRIPEPDTPPTNSPNFTSLPPVNSGDVNCNQKRRFSDPGLNNVDESNESSCSESVSDRYSLVNSSLIEQISELESENKRLFLELECTKNELKIIKSEIALISNKITCHESPSLAEMVKEIREAAQIRENALISKVEALIEKCIKSKSANNSAEDIDTLKSRLSVLEHQLDRLRIHSRVDSKMNGDVTAEEIESIEKRKNETVENIPNNCGKKDCTKEKDVNCNAKLNSCLENLQITSDGAGNSLSTVSCESLSSSLGPGSLHSATVTLCGPVTDL